MPRGTRARDVSIQFKPTHVLVGMKGESPIIDGKLPERILVDDCTWNLEVENGELTITLEVNQSLSTITLCAVLSYCSRVFMINGVHVAESEWEVVEIPTTHLTSCGRPRGVITKGLCVSLCLWLKRCLLIDA